MYKHEMCAHTHLKGTLNKTQHIDAKEMSTVYSASIHIKQGFCVMGANQLHI